MKPLLFLRRSFRGGAGICGAEAMGRRATARNLTGLRKSIAILHIENFGEQTA
jgi:hypothetical protein